MSKNGLCQENTKHISEKEPEQSQAEMPQWESKQNHYQSIIFFLIACWLSSAPGCWKLLRKDKTGNKNLFLDGFQVWKVNAYVPVV